MVESRDRRTVMRGVSARSASRGRTSGRRHGLRVYGLRAVVALAIAGLLFLVIEGFCGTVVVVQEFFKRSHWVTTAQAHLTYDPGLGWVSLPNLSLENLFGPGVFLKTNTQGFRNEETLSVEVPPGRCRVLCSGDSFTFGYGVANDHTWCHRLGVIDPRLEPVNMGQGAYGVDQSFLWYLRDGQVLDHDVHLFAFIAHDFERMKHDNYAGYGKPVLAINGGELVTKNVPVPRVRPRLTHNVNVLKHALKQFRSVSFLRTMVRQHVLQHASAMASDDHPEDHPMEDIVSKVFETLHEINRAKGSTLVLVFLPTSADYRGAESDHWRGYVHAESARQGIAFIDVVEAFKTLPPSEVERLFIPEGAMDPLGLASHYTVAGNEYVAQTLYQRLTSRPEVRAKLSASEARTRLRGASP